MYFLIYLLSVCIVFALFCILAAKGKGSLFHSLSKKAHPLRWFYPAGYEIYLIGAKHIFSKKETQEKKNQLRALHPEEDIETVYLVYQTKKITMALILVVMFHFLALCYVAANQGSRQVNQKNQIRREDYCGEDKTVYLDVVGSDGTDQIKEEVQLEVGALEYTREQVEAQMDEIEQALPDRIKGDNNSLQEVTGNLDLITSWEKSPVQFNWYSSKPDVVSEEGTVSSKGLLKEEDVRLELRLSWKDIDRVVTCDIHVIPVEQSLKEQVVQYVTDGIKQQEESTRESVLFSLPAKYKGYQLYYKEKKDNTAVTLCFMGVLAGLAGYLLSDQQEKKKQLFREKQMQMDYPEIISKFTLLVSAGLTVRNAWEKLVQDYQEKRHKGGEMQYAYEEMKITMQELKNGIVETEAYEHFGRRTKVLAYMRFGSLLAQNVKKGSKGLMDLLEREGQNAYEERKQTAKRLGEEAGTKLLFPMMLYLLIVLAIVMVPAMMTM